MSIVSPKLLRGTALAAVLLSAITVSVASRAQDDAASNAGQSSGWVDTASVPVDVAPDTAHISNIDAGN
ncbi:MAG: hypothetical protein WCC64_02700 [Aliidongia sp.]